jgi:hypothetical protein
MQVKRNGLPVSGLFLKAVTQGDAARFVGAETGYVQIINLHDDTVLPDGRRRVTIGPNYSPPNNTPSYVEFVLNFNYFVGLNQIKASLLDAGDTGRLVPLLNRQAIYQARLDWPAWQNPPYDTVLDPTDQYTVQFQEISRDTIRIISPGTTDIFVFEVPHTSLQATSRNRIMVSNQGDNAAIELMGEGDGILLKSRRGRRGLLRIDESLQIGVEPR